MTEVVQHNSLPRVPLAVIFDLDDTLFNTSLSIDELLMPTLKEHGIESDEINEARAAAHRQNNRSLDVVEYTIDRLGPKVWDDMAREYVEKGKRLDLLLPGARVAMNTLRQANIPFGIKTYGNERLQLLKRDTVGIPVTVPFHVIDHREKGEMLKSMYDAEDQSFAIEWLGCKAMQVVMLENDPSAFNGLEEHIEASRVLALWVPHTEADRAKPQPKGLVRANSIREAMTIAAKWATEPSIAA